MTRLRSVLLWPLFAATLLLPSDLRAQDEVWPRQRAAGPFYWHADVAEPRPSAEVRR